MKLQKLSSLFLLIAFFASKEVLTMDDITYSDLLTRFGDEDPSQPINLDQNNLNDSKKQQEEEKENTEDVSDLQDADLDESKKEEAAGFFGWVKSWWESKQAQENQKVKSSQVSDCGSSKTSLSSQDFQSIMNNEQTTNSENMNLRDGNSEINTVNEFFIKTTYPDLDEIIFDPRVLLEGNQFTVVMTQNNSEHSNSVNDNSKSEKSNHSGDSVELTGSSFMMLDRPAEHTGNSDFVMIDKPTENADKDNIENDFIEVDPTSLDELREWPDQNNSGQNSNKKHKQTWGSWAQSLVKAPLKEAGDHVAKKAVNEALDQAERRYGKYVIGCAGFLLVSYIIYKLGKLEGQTRTN